MRRKRAFTLIELLFVVAIIAVLAGIAVPNFLEAQTRSKLARTRADLAILYAGLRAYGAEYDAYPPNQEAVQAGLLQNMPGVDDNGDGYLVKSGWALTPLTTPIGWIARQLPQDVFQNRSGKMMSMVSSPSEWEPPVRFAYVNLFAVRDDASTTSAQAGFVLISAGPDQRLRPLLSDPAAQISYDPTNGTTSKGDLYSWGW